MIVKGILNCPTSLAENLSENFELKLILEGTQNFELKLILEGTASHTVKLLRRVEYTWMWSIPS